MFSTVRIARHERGFLFRDSEFQRVLEPGDHLLWLGLFSGRKYTVRKVSELAPRLRFDEAELVGRSPLAAAHVEIHRIGDGQRGLVFRDGEFKEFLPTGFHVFLRSPIPSKVEVVDIHEPEVTHPARDVLARGPDASTFLLTVEVPESHSGLVYVDQILRSVTKPGRYFFWNGLRAVRVAVLDGREQTLEVQGQELMTQDKVSLRLNLTVRWRLVDPAKALAQQSNFKDALYRDVQLALRDEVGGRTFDDLLSRKEAVGEALLARVGPSAAAMGLEVAAAGIRDIILPGEMRTILNQVIEAEKRAQANMIARREETAATRNLLNTAKLLENNPVLMHLKELESAERIAEKIQRLSVYGGVDGLLGAFKQLTGARGPDGEEK